MSEGINVFAVTQHHHTDLELRDISAVWGFTEVLYVEAASLDGHLRIQFSHIKAIGIDVDLVHSWLRHVEHVEIFSKLLGKGRFTGSDWTFNNNQLKQDRKKLVEGLITTTTKTIYLCVVIKSFGGFVEDSLEETVALIFVWIRFWFHQVLGRSDDFSSNSTRLNHCWNCSFY